LWVVGSAGQRSAKHLDKAGRFTRSVALVLLRHADPPDKIRGKIGEMRQEKGHARPLELSLVRSRLFCSICECDSRLTWNRRGAILRQPGCSTPRRIPGGRLHPFESRKTRSTVICCILFLRNTPRKRLPTPGLAAVAQGADPFSNQASAPRHCERAVANRAVPLMGSRGNCWRFQAELSRLWLIVRLKFWPDRTPTDRGLGEGSKPC
jgi:hypothetical protein